jgi:HEAT repeat protein
MPLFGPPNIAQLEAKRDTQGLIKALLFKDAAIRMAAADALAPLKDPLAVEPLAALLRDEHAGVRRAAVGALAERGGVRVVEPLVAALNDPDPEVQDVAAHAVFKRLMTDPDQETRRGTATALGKIRWSDAVGPLVKAVMDADESVRLASIRALQAIDDVYAVLPLIIVQAHEQVRQKTTGRSSLVVERAAAQALEALCDDRAIPQLRTALAHDDADVREIAVKRLARIPSPQIVDALAAAIDDRDPVVRRTAARGLAETGWQPPANAIGARYWAAMREWRRCAECGPEAIPLLLASFATVDALERSDILNALGQLKWEPTESDAVAGHYYASLRRWDKCVEIGGPAAEALDGILRKAPSWRDRVSAAGALGDIGQERKAPFSRLDLVRRALEIQDGADEVEAKRVALEAMLAEAHQYDPAKEERVEWCKCGFPASRVKSDGLREPLVDLLGFEQTSSNSTTYYCPSCDTRRTTVAA